MERSDRKVKKTKLISESSLCNLPDCILHHILSSLGTRETLRTSILSKRWRFLWASVSNLEFHEDMADHHAHRESFLAIVTRVLHLHKDSNISKFSLCCKVNVNARVIYEWISAVLIHNVGILFIRLSDFKEPFALPHSLFIHKSLTKLLIEMDQPLKLPAYVCFTTLKVLTLQTVTFCDGNLTNKLFSGCLVLEELYLTNCSWGDLKAVTISCPNLVYFSIQHTYEDFDEYGCKVTITASNLKAFSCLSKFIDEYVFSQTPSLIYAYIDFSVEEQEIGNLGKLVRQLRNVEWLILDATFGSVSLEEVMGTLAYEYEMPMFINLTELELNVHMEFNRVDIFELLKKFPNLKSWIILSIECDCHSPHCPEKDPMECQGDHWYIELINETSWVPPCFLSQLRTVEIRQFKGARLEIRFVRILLKNALVLEELVLHYNGKSDEERQKIVDELLSLPERSSRCSIVFRDVDQDPDEPVF